MIFLRISISGTVQGVGFRYFAYKNAEELGLSGYVRNESDGSLSIWVCGAQEAIEIFCNEMRTGPSRSVVKDFKILEQGKCNDESGFYIR